jgi:integrase
MVLLSLNTGLRRGELTSITRGDVDLRAKVVAICGGYSKAGRARHIQLNSEAIEVLKRYKKQHSGEGRIFTVHSVKKAWGELLTKAKISGFRWHDLRHSFASRLVMKGVDLNTVRELLGHSSLTMTLRYAHLVPEHKAAAVEKLVR